MGFLTISGIDREQPSVGILEYHRMKCGAVMVSRKRLRSKRVTGHNNKEMLAVSYETG